MKDLILINPINHNKTKINPVALQILESVCIAKGYSVEIMDFVKDMIDENIAYDTEIFKWIENKITKIRAKCFGITTMNASFIWCKQIINIIKRLYPDAVVFLGGPHVTGLKSEIFNEISNVDYLILYEGERTIIEFMDFIFGKNEELPINVIDKNSLYKVGKLTCEDLDAIPKLNYGRYLNLKIIDVEVGRACPFDCYYCSSRSLLGRNVRYKNITRILTESQTVFDNMDEQNKVCINFTHDNFLSNKFIFREFINRKIEGNFDFTYGCGGRIDLIDDEVIEWLVVSGCKYIFVGIETGSKKIQKICRKDLDLNSIEEKIKKLTQNSIYVEANFIIGFPEENIHDLYQTLRFIPKLAWISPMVNCGFSYMSPEPCTDIYDKAKQEDYVIVKNSQYYKELANVGIKPETLNPKHYNHLYTIKNENYDIIRYIETSWKYLELLRRYFVSSNLFFNILGYDIIKGFERLADMDNEDELIYYYFKIASNNMTDTQKVIVQYEIDRNKIKKGKVKEARFVYEFPVQKMYKMFLINSDSYKMWATQKKIRTEVINKNDK